MKYFIWFVDFTMFLALSPEPSWPAKILRKTPITYAPWPHLYCWFRLEKRCNSCRNGCRSCLAKQIEVCLEAIESQKIVVFTNVTFFRYIVVVTPCDSILSIFHLPSFTILIWFWRLNERPKDRTFPINSSFRLNILRIGIEKKKVKQVIIEWAWPSGHDFVTFMFHVLPNRQPSASWLSSKCNMYRISIEHI